MWCLIIVVGGLVAPVGRVSAAPVKAGPSASARSGQGHTPARLPAGVHPPVPPGPVSRRAGLAQSTVLATAQTHCDPALTDASGFQREFDRRGPVWGGGDGAEPVPIDGGRTLWLFADTYLGGGPSGGPLTVTGFVHNSMVIQHDGSCFDYLFGGSATSGWASTIPEPNASDYYWPNSGSYDSSTGIVSIVATHVRTVTPGDPWGWIVLGENVIRYQVQPTLTLIDDRPLFNYQPGDIAQFGASTLIDGGWVYFYGCAQNGPSQCYLARTSTSIDPTTVAYRTSTGWSTSQADATSLAIADPAGNELHVTRIAGRYIASTQLAILGHTTSGWWAPTPSGPFKPIGQLFDETSPPAGPMHTNWFTYGGRIITTSVGPVGVFSVNTWDDEGGQIAGVYGPRFVPVDPNQIHDRSYGALDAPTWSTAGLVVTGAATDPNSPDPVTVHLTLDGADVGSTPADKLRQGPTGSTGFETTLALPRGVHQLCATAGNLAPDVQNSVLGCRSTDADLFIPIDPVRIMDTRPSSQIGALSSPWGPATTHTITVADADHVPADADAVSLNVTVTNTTDESHLDLWPAGETQPTTSNLNWAPGSTLPNAVTVKVGSSGQINIYNNRGRADVIIDVLGYYAVGPGAGYTSIAPQRILDSRPSSQVGPYVTPWGNATTRNITVTGAHGIPNDASAVVVNATATNTTGSSHLDLWPAGQAKPNTSSLNWVAGGTVPNAATIRVGADGQISAYNNSGTADIILDVVGYFQADAGSPFHPLSPERILDSRPSSQVGSFSTPWSTTTTRDITVTGLAGIPTGAPTVMMNVTVTDTTGYSHLDLGPAGRAKTPTSNLNWIPGSTVSNNVTASVDAAGQISIYNNTGTADVIADVGGWYG
jgi:hypothetical protein